MFFNSFQHFMILDGIWSTEVEHHLCLNIAEYSTSKPLWLDRDRLTITHSNWYRNFTQTPKQVKVGLVANLHLFYFKPGVARIFDWEAERVKLRQIRFNYSMLQLICMFLDNTLSLKLNHKNWMLWIKRLKDCDLKLKGVMK